MGQHVAGTAAVLALCMAEATRREWQTERCSKRDEDCPQKNLSSILILGRPCASSAYHHKDVYGCASRIYPCSFKPARATWILAECVDVRLCVACQPGSSKNAFPFHSPFLTAVRIAKVIQRKPHPYTCSIAYLERLASSTSGSTCGAGGQAGRCLCQGLGGCSICRNLNLKKIIRTWELGLSCSHGKWCTCRLFFGGL